MTRQQEKIVLQRLETIRQAKMSELHKEKNERRRKVAGAYARLADAAEKKAKVRDAVMAITLAVMRKGCLDMAFNMSRLPEYTKFYQQEQAELAALDREYSERETKLNAAAETLSIRLVLGNDANEVIALLDQFGKEKF